jgi:Ni/Fe-hydrogenase subunit HybB-like protein
MIQKDQQIYYPSLVESVVTVGIIAAHILFFALIARYFPIFEHHPEGVDYSIPDSFRRIKKSLVTERAQAGT